MVSDRSTPPTQPKPDPLVICLGEALIDRIADRPTDPRKGQGTTDYPGGALANVATALAKLGTPVGFIGGLGSDTAGDHLLAVLLEAGVNGQGVQRCADPTRVVLVERTATGDRQFVGFVPSPTGSFADAALSLSEVDSSGIDRARYLVMGTLGLAAPALGQSMTIALERVQSNGGLAVVDLNWRSPFWPNPNRAPAQILPFLHRVDLLKLSQEEADWLFHTQDAGQILHRLGQAKLVLITGGSAGCWYASNEQQGHVPPFAVPAVETTGAGDAFLAGLLHAFCQGGHGGIPQGDRLVEAVRYANATGALTTTQPGAMVAQPRAEAVEALLRHS
jgi:fructokinase